MPEEEPMPAVNGALELQAPVAGVEFKVTFEPTHKFSPPEGVIAEGMVLTVTCAMEKQAPIEQDIIVVPAAIPVSAPVAGLMVPAAVFVLLHTPIVAASVSVDVSPAQRDELAGVIARLVL